jgi:hypothetical protein
MGNLFKNINEEVRELEGKKTSFSFPSVEAAGIDV